MRQGVFEPARHCIYFAADPIYLLAGMTTAEPDGAQLQADVEEIRRRLAAPAGHVHMLGACGVGMAGLALLLLRRGFTVSGCDLHRGRLGDWLEDRGIPVRDGHDPSHIDSTVAWCVRSAAVPESSPEVAEARRHGIPVYRRGAVLPALLHGRLSVAVSGTHGKTTTTSFLAQVLAASGLEPSFCVGGEVPPLGGVAGASRDEILVVEADESDGTVALYEPDIAIVTNIEFDHMEHFANVAAFEECFRSLARRTRRRVVYCVDDPRAAALCAGHPLALPYGFGPEAAVRAEALAESPAGLTYRLILRGEPAGEIRLSVPGRHNALNSLAVTAAALELGLTPDAIRTGLARVTLPRRRLDVVAARDGVTVMSDYAHHPTEVAALVRTAAGLGHPRLVAVFQPHRYTRTRALGADFPAAFAGIEELVLLPVYAASEQPLEGGSMWDLYAHFRRHGGTRAVAAASLGQAWAYWQRRLQAGDLFLVIGAGDVERIAEWAARDLGRAGLPGLDPTAAWREAVARLGLTASDVRSDEPVGSKTTLGVGGCADLWIGIGNEDDLGRVLRWTRADAVPFHLLGGGSNTLISDLGVRGVVARLAGPGFRGIRIEGRRVTAGAATPISRLLSALEEAGLGGLEFLQDIPGTLGGAIAMNAGAWGEEIGPRVVRVRAADGSGTTVRLDGPAMGFGYRSCPGLAGLVAVDIELECTPADPAAIRARRVEIAGRREWMRGMRSAGSIFRNPPGSPPAGRLIDEAGLKGLAVGGARISEPHANVIAAGPDARASDVLALMESARDAVRRRTGVELRPEIKILS